MGLLTSSRGGEQTWGETNRDWSCIIHHIEKFRLIASHRGEGWRFKARESGEVDPFAKAPRHIMIEDGDHVMSFVVVERHRFGPAM